MRSPRSATLILRRPMDIDTISSKPPTQSLVPSPWHRDVTRDQLLQSSGDPWPLDINRSPRGHLTTTAICYSNPPTPVRRRSHLTLTVICFSFPRRLPSDLLLGQTTLVWCRRCGHPTSMTICFSCPRDLLLGQTVHKGGQVTGKCCSTNCPNPINIVCSDCSSNATLYELII